MSTAYAQAEPLATAYTQSPYSNAHSQSMDGRQGDYTPHSGLSSPSNARPDLHSEGSHTDQASAAAAAAAAAAAQYNTPPQDVKFAHSAAPPQDYPLTAATRPNGQFPEQYIQRGYPDGSQRYQQQQQQQQQPTSAPASMAQTTSPSTMPPKDHSNGHYEASSAPDSNMAIPVDPNIAASSPTYPQQHHYSPYPDQHGVPHYQPPPMYRPEYGAYPGHPHMPGPYGHVATTMGGPPGMVSAGTRPPGVSAHDYPPHHANTYPAQGGHPLSTVYSFVPIPGTHQQKRPRRRYEEIERMYKCGWNGCEKAYGTLNHLNAHVTMQSHGTKRTPEEFKEIRKEWKARKKEQESQQKAEDERQRQAVQQNGQVDGQPTGDGTPGGPSSQYPQTVRQLPPLGYAPASGQVPTQYGQPGGPMEGAPIQYNGQMQGYYSHPQSPYGQQNPMYSQHHPTVPGQSEAATTQ